MNYRCPPCGSELEKTPGYLACRSCGETYTNEGYYDFLGDEGPTNEDVVSLFDTVSSIYETPLWYPVGMRMATGGRSSVGELVERVVETVETEHPDEVVDVACGTGLFARNLAENATVYGVDASSEMLRRAHRNARERGVYLEISRADAGNLPYGDSSFDAATCCGALHILPEPAETLEDIGRVVRHDGVLVVTTLVDDGYLGLPMMKQSMRRIYNLKVFDTENLDRMLDDAGFERVDTARESSLVTFTARRR
jgi:SAM-dependent methyltransferase